MELLNLYRVIQEAVQNTLKYAEASSIKIHFEESEGGIRLVISDNGKGISPETSDGNGLRNMRYRCEQIGGTFELKSMKDEGTVISCTFGI